MKSLFLTLTLFFSLTLSAQSIEGKWKTIDDNSGKVKSIVKIYLSGGKLYGKILKTYPDEGESDDPICDKCKGNKKDKKVIGMNIIMGLSKDGDNWKKDNGILDPENGKIYDCKIWLESSNKLAVRGYIGFFYRTQYWVKVK